VRIRRRLAAARPDAFLPGLAIALINLSEALAAVTPPRREEALKAIEESVSIHRRLFNVSPETYQIFLVESLSTQSNRLSELGRLEDAHEVITEAIELALPIYRKNPHRLRDPDQRLLQPYLDLCECLQWPPDPKIVAPMNAALAATNSFRNEE
jgi:hypothetical protein